MILKLELTKASETKEMSERTIDTILARIEQHVVEKAVLPPGDWIDAALAMTALLGDEHGKLFLLQQALAKKKAESVEAGKSVASARLIVQSSDEWVVMKIQEAKIGRVEEMIRCAKIRARMADNEYKAN